MAFPPDSLFGDWRNRDSCVAMLPRLADEDVRKQSCRADLLCMPMLDSAANNVFLESMACGTPVMTNRVGGVPEYVAGSCNAVMPLDAGVDDWVDRLFEFERDRALLESMRGPARTWVEKFDWRIVADEYRAMYRAVVDMAKSGMCG